MKAIVALLLIAGAFAAKSTTQDQILSLLQTGTKARDAIDSVFELLNDLKESNEEAQYAADEKNRTDEEIGQSTISKFTQVVSLNQKISSEAEQTRLHFEQELRDTKTYLAWNEARREEIERKRQSLDDNQCLSNQLFVRSIKQSQEALSAIALLKGDLQSYVATGSDIEFAQISNTEVKTVADKLRKYSSIFNTNEINTFLQLAESSSDSTSESEEEASAPGRRRGTLPEQLLQVLNDLEERVEESLEHLKENEIAAAWQLAGWLQSSEAETIHLETEFERKTTYADRCQTQIQGALGAQAKAKIILEESNNALQQAISDLENKREVYAEEKAKRDEENAILDEVITQFKNQVSSWSGRF